LNEPIPWYRRLILFARYLVPKLGRAGFFSLLVLRYIAKHGRPNAKRWLFLFTIVGTDIWIAQQLTPSWFAERHKGPTLMAGALVGWLQFRILIKQLDHSPRIPPRYWPGIVVGWLLCSAVLDFTFVHPRKRGENLDLTSKPMVAATRGEPQAILPENLPSVDLQKVGETVKAVPRKVLSRTEQAKQELNVIREEMKRDGATNPLPYMITHVRAQYYAENPPKEGEENLIDRYREWRENLKREYDAVREMNAEESAAEEKKKRRLEEAKQTIVITASDAKRGQE
jgi:hypothetical protein